MAGMAALTAFAIEFIAWWGTGGPPWGEDMAKVQVELSSWEVGC